MNMQVLGLGLDILILVLLVATIYYAFRLSRSLKAFRADRSTFEQVIARLTASIEQAHAAVDNLKAAGENSGQDLQKIVHQAKGMADELHLLNEAGNALAARLEGLAEKNRRSAVSPGRKRKPGAQAPFVVRDDDVQPDTLADEAGHDVPEDLKSDAERELYRALHGRGQA